MPILWFARSCDLGLDPVRADRGGAVRMRRLTSQALLFMGWRVEVAGADVMTEARGWLVRHGILPRPG